MCLEQARQSCAANGLDGVKVIGITWGLYNPAIVSLSAVDVILGSDCFYDTKGDKLLHCDCDTIWAPGLHTFHARIPVND